MTDLQYKFNGKYAERGKSRGRKHNLENEQAKNYEAVAVCSSLFIVKLQAYCLFWAYQTR